MKKFLSLATLLGVSTAILGAATLHPGSPAGGRTIPPVNRKGEYNCSLCKTLNPKSCKEKLRWDHPPNGMEARVAFEAALAQADTPDADDGLGDCAVVVELNSRVA